MILAVPVQSTIIISNSNLAQAELANLSFFLLL